MIGLQAGGAGGGDGFQRAGKDAFHLLGIQLAQGGNRVQRQRQGAGKGAGADPDDENDRPRSAPRSTRRVFRIVRVTL